MTERQSDTIARLKDRIETLQVVIDLSSELTTEEIWELNMQFINLVLKAGQLERGCRAKKKKRLR